MNHKQKIKQIIFALFIFSILASTPLWAWFSFFKLSNINWEGNRKISSEQLDQNFQFLLGKNIFKIKLEKIEEKRPIILVHAKRLLGLSLDLELIPLDSLTEDLPVITGCSFSQVKYYKKLKSKELNLAWDLYQTFLKKDLNLANRI